MRRDSDENNFNTTISWKLAPELSAAEKLKKSEVTRAGEIELIDEAVIQAEIEEIVEGIFIIGDSNLESYSTL